MKQLILLTLLLCAGVQAARVEPVYMAPQPQVKTIVNRDIVFNNSVTRHSVNALIASVKMLHLVLPINEPITIVYTSPGGAVFAGMKFMNLVAAMQKQGRVFIGIVDRFCASMCFSFLQVMDKRQSYPLGLLMQHKVSGGRKAIMDVMDKMLEKISAKRINVDPKIWAYITKANIWISPEDALAWNIIDEIVVPKL